MQWTSERRHRMELAQRYKSSAERAFHKAWSVLQGLRKDIMRVEDQKFKLQLEIIKLNKAHEKTEQQREKEPEEEPVKSTKMIVIYTDPDGKVIRDERVGGKVVKREEVFLE
jgi:hypothetical protein